MNKKTKLILAVLLVSIVLFLGYKTFLSPKAVEGEKSVKVHVIIEKEEIDKTFTYNTDLDFLLDLLEEKQEELGVTLESTDFGAMITGMMDYTADPSQNEYFHILINDEDAMTGAGEIPLKDGDVYIFELRTY